MVPVSRWCFDVTLSVIPVVSRSSKEIKLNMKMLTVSWQTINIYSLERFAHLCHTMAVSSWLDFLHLLMSISCQMVSEHHFKIHILSHLLFPPSVIGCILPLKNVGLIWYNLLLTIHPVWVPPPLFPDSCFWIIAQLTLQGSWGSILAGLFHFYEDSNYAWLSPVLRIISVLQESQI